MNGVVWCVQRVEQCGRSMDNAGMMVCSVLWSVALFMFWGGARPELKSAMILRNQNEKVPQ